MISNTLIFIIFSSITPPPQELGIVTEYFTYVCNSQTRNIFLSILYGYKMLLQVIGLVLAFSTRKVKVKGLDDAKYIAAAIYVTSIVLAVIIVAIYSLEDFVNAFPALFCTGFLIGTTSILGLVFVPKVGRCVRQRTSSVSVAQSLFHHLFLSSKGCVSQETFPSISELELSTLAIGREKTLLLSQRLELGTFQFIAQHFDH